MAEAIMNYKVKKSVVKPKGSYQAVADSINYLKLKFDFSDEWKDCERIVATAISRLDDSVTDSRQVVNGIYNVPTALIEVPGFVFGLAGYDIDGNVKITTQKYQVAVKASGFAKDITEPAVEQKNAFDEAMAETAKAVGSINYLHIKWSNAEPVADTDLLDTPADWLGVYCGGEKTAPTAYGAYSWYKVKGLQGEQGLQGIQGIQGEPFRYSDFTDEQLALLKGEKGEPFTYSDFTEEQLAGLKGEKGDPFRYSDFTEEQLAGLKGDKGESGVQGIGIHGIAFKEATASGNVYTVTLTDGSAYEIVAPRGAAGEGSGDMISAVYDKNNKATDIFDYADEKAKEVEDKIPTVPTKVSELVNDKGYLTEHQDISGKYEKPKSGIPKSDLSSDVQNSLGKADTALQSHQDISAKYEKPACGIPKTDLASDVQTSLDKADSALQEHQDISGKANVDLSNVNAESLKAAIEGAGISSGAKTHIVYIEESQNWTVPEGVTEIIVYLIGGGGGGGSYASYGTAGSGGGAGGGGGGYATTAIINVTPGEVIPIVIGAGGGSDTAGGSSIFGNRLFVSGGLPGGKWDKNDGRGAGGSGGAGGGAGALAGGSGIGEDGEGTSDVLGGQGGRSLLCTYRGGFCCITGELYGGGGGGGATLNSSRYDGGSGGAGGGGNGGSYSSTGGAGSAGTLYGAGGGGQMAFSRAGGGSGHAGVCIIAY